MGELIAGGQSGNAIVPYGPVTKRTKTVDIISYLSATSNGGALTLAKAIAYADSGDNWFADFYLQGSKTNNATEATFTFDSGTFNFVGIWPISSFNTINQTAYIGGVDQIRCGPNPSSYAGVYASGHGIPLSAAPSWAAANLEQVSADQYIKPATSLVPGLVGGSNGVAVSSGQIGEIQEGNTTGVSMNTINTNNQGSLTLTSGLYLFNFNGYIIDGDAFVNQEALHLCISLANNNMNGAFGGKQGKANMRGSVNAGTNTIGNVTMCFTAYLAAADTLYFNAALNEGSGTYSAHFYWSATRLG